MIMPTFIKMRYDDHLVRDMLGRFYTQIPKSSMKDLEDIARASRSEMRRELTMQGRNWTKTLWEGIHVDKTDKNTIGLFVPMYGIHMDTMKPHWVSLDRLAFMGIGEGLTVRDWVRTKGRNIKLKKGRNKIYVRPHPWIANGVRKATLKARQLARQSKNVRKTIRSKGRL